MVLSGNEDYEKTNGGFTKFDVSVEEESAVGAADWEVLESYLGVDLDTDTDDNFIETIVNSQTKYMKITAGTGYNIPTGLQEQLNQYEGLFFGDGATTSLSGTLVHVPVRAGSLTITNGANEYTDDGAGAITGTGVTSGTINYTTGAWTLVLGTAPGSGVLVYAEYTKTPTAETVSAQMTGGTDGTAVTNTLITAPALEGDNEGIYAFDKINEVLNVSLPDFAGDKSTMDALIAWNNNAERQNRFIIMATPSSLTPTAAKDWMRNTAKFNTSYGAVYYPWVTIEDPLSTDKRPVNVPPDGFIAGVFARTDVNRNVGKAPAGINEGQLIGAIGLERDLILRERKVVSPARLNVLVNTPETGIAVWGARLASLDPEWVYIQARRLFLFVEMSIENASYWAVFENNGPGTWGKLQAQGESFLSRIFKDGYLKGTTPAEAYSVVVDSSNNPPASVDAGLVTVDYYLAVNKPAEFVLMRYTRKLD
jgi:phage tail sheath protein FI